MPEQRLIRLELPEEAPAPSAFAEADRRQAIADLLAGNRFDPPNLPPGPYALAVSVREGRLVLDIRDVDNRPLHVLALALGPFRRLIKDYHMVVEAHEQAVAESGPESRVQAIDMGRRGLHNEAAGILMERLAGKIDIDFDTARRLFTLLTALHWKG